MLLEVRLCASFKRSALGHINCNRLTKEEVGKVVYVPPEVCKLWQENKSAGDAFYCVVWFSGLTGVKKGDYSTMQICW